MLNISSTQGINLVKHIAITC